LNTRTEHGPRHGGPRGPPEWPNQKPPRAGFASLEGSHLPRAGSASLEGSRLPRAGSASLEGQHPPRAGSASLEGSPPPRSRLPHKRACSRTRVRAFNALTQQSRAITRPGITPRRCSANSLGEAHPRALQGAVWYGLCQPRGTVLPTPVWLTRRALEGGTAASSNPSLVNLQGQTMTSGQRERHPLHCWSCAAVPVPAAPRRALLQQLRRC
jgi:hypothetical protein